MLISLCKTLTLIQLYFRAFLHGEFACTVILQICMRLSVSQHYHRTLENINIWDITVVSEHDPCHLWAHSNRIKVHVDACVYMQMHVSDVGEVYVKTKVFLCQLVRT